MTDIYHEQLAEGERVELALGPAEVVYRVEFYSNGGWWWPVDDTRTGGADYSNYVDARNAALEFHKRRPNLPVRIVSRNFEVPS